MKSKMAVLIAAGLAMSSIASLAQAATNLDPNLAPSTIAEGGEIAHAGANTPELAADPDPNLAPTTTIDEARIRGDDQGAPELAIAPDPNLVASTVD
jgi:hypothetical protein